MRHVSNATLTSVEENPYFRLSGSELVSCEFMLSGRFRSAISQGNGGFGIRIFMNKEDGFVEYPFIKTVPQQFGTCYEMEFHIGGYVKDGRVHACAIFASASVPAPTSLPHQVYEVQGSVAVDGDVKSIGIAITPIRFATEFSISGEIV